MARPEKKMDLLVVAFIRSNCDLKIKKIVLAIWEEYCCCLCQIQLANICNRHAPNLIYITICKNHLNRISYRFLCMAFTIKHIMGMSSYDHAGCEKLETVTRDGESRQKTFLKSQLASALFLDRRPSIGILSSFPLLLLHTE